VPIRTYKDLNVFRESYRLALDVSRATRAFPPPEQFEMARQLRRAARSVPANIVEGWAKRSSAPEFKRYLQVAIGSCDECKLWLEMSRDEGYLIDAGFKDLSNRFNVVGAMLKSLWKQWQSFSS
jgi:four helix bundle protein